MALQREINDYTGLLEAIENSPVKEYVKRVPDFFMCYESIKAGIESRKKRLEQVVREDTCIFCGDLTIIWYEEKYKGYMGRCDRCESNWRES